jgi:hypothetical protein
MPARNARRRQRCEELDASSSFPCEPPAKAAAAAAAAVGRSGDQPRGLLQVENTPNCKTKVPFSIKSSNLQKVTDFWIFTEKSLD